MTSTFHLRATRVFVREFSDADLETYLATRQWEGCSGAYAIQGNDDPYVKVVAGSVSNVIGLPMEGLAKVLAEHFSLLTAPPKI